MTMSDTPQAAPAKREPRPAPTLNRLPLARAFEGSANTWRASPSAWGGEISVAHPIFANHQAYGRSLLPGLAYIDIVLDWCSAQGLDTRQVEIRDLSIFQPMTLREGQSLCLRPSAEEIAGGWHLRIAAAVRRGRDGGTDLVTFATADVARLPETSFSDAVDRGEVLARATRILDLEEAYARWRDLELFHSGQMKAAGRIITTEEATWIELEAPKDDHQGYIVNPVLVDGSIVGAVELIAELAQGERRLFLPLHFGAFRTTAPLTTACLARIRHTDVERRGELISLSIEYFDAAGHKVAELSNFNNKLVRQSGLISGDLAEPSLPRAPAQPAAPEPRLTRPPSGKGPSVDPAVDRLVKSAVAARLQVAETTLDLDAGYYDLGLTSAMMLEVVQAIGDALGRVLPPTLLFEHTTVRALIDHLSPPIEASAIAAEAPRRPEPAVHRETGGPPSARSRISSAPEQIAIIGLAGRYPGSNTIGEFWENLKAGRDLITDVPADRWDWRQLAQTRSPSGKPMSRWGGFIDDVLCFDPLFFKISPREAASIDPQERQFLEVCWEAIEDAGYTPPSLSPVSAHGRRRVGVFVGVMHKDYALLGAEALQEGRDVALSLNHAPIANRVSYTYDFHGPSMAVDTVCSASLTAIHLAAESLRSGECAVAIAGGVNLSLHSSKYRTYGMMDMHASDGRCRAFGEGGDGYVSAEGVGAAILKPLEQALAAGDHIYGLLRASAVNHVGRASGMTVPSPVAQGEMIAECFEKAGVDARSVTCIEAHGTGTSLGDPIEVQGLVRAFRRYTPDTAFCALGSVKSNIGHAESAAGISGLTKALLQLRHKTLVSTLHSQVANPLLDLASGPFFLPQETQPWPAGPDGPRRIGVSSFGATGSNAHALLEEFMPDAQATPPERRPVLVPLSARSREQVILYARRLAAFLEIRSAQGLAIDLEALAFTLQVGRVPQPSRLAIRASTPDELAEQLRSFIAGQRGGQDLWAADVAEADAGLLAALGRDAALREVMECCLRERRLAEVAMLWVRGAPVAWEELHPINHPRRMSLPTYPFVREICAFPPPPAEAPAREEAPHPLLHENISDLTQQKFRSRFSGQEPFFDPRGENGPTLTSAALLAMAVGAARRSWPDPDPIGVSLSQIAWGLPVTTSGAGAQVTVTVVGQDEDGPRLQVEVIGEGAGSHLLGSASFLLTAPSPFSLATVRSRLAGRESTDDELAILQASLGDAVELTAAWCGQDEVLLAFAEAPARGVPASPDVRRLAMLSATLDLTLGGPLATGADARSQIARLDQLQIFDGGAARMLAWCRRRLTDGVTVWDIDLCTAEGALTATMRGLVGAVRAEASPGAAAPRPVLRFQETWGVAPLGATSISPGVTVCILSDVRLRAALAAAMASSAPDARLIFATPGQSYERRVRTDYVCPIDPDGLRRLFEAVRADFDEIGSVLLLSPLEHEPGEHDHLAIAALIQALAGWAPNTRRLLLAGRSSTPEGRAHLDGFIGFERSLTAVLPGTKVVTLSFDADAEAAAPVALADILLSELIRGAGPARYVAGERLGPSLGLLDGSVRGMSGSPFRQGGAYLVTGGLGGLGLVLAEHLCLRYQARCVLLGRSAPGPALQARLQSFEAMGGEILCLQADVADETAMAAALTAAEARFGPLDGVFHAAGVVGADTVQTYSPEGFGSVLSAKVSGTLVLERLLRDRALDFVCLFSSTSAILGDFGSCDYAVGNRFQLALGRQMSTRHGVPWTVMAWPLWRDGGMGLSPAATDLYLEASGQRLLETPEALVELQDAIAAGRAHTVVMCGEPAKIAGFLNRRSVGERRQAPESAETIIEPHGVSEGAADLFRRALRALQDAAHDLLGAPLSALQAQVNLADFGFDSISFTRFAQAVGDRFGVKVAPSEFYTYATLGAFARHLVDDHGSAVARACPPEAGDPIAEPQDALAQSTASQRKDRQLGGLRHGLKGLETRPEPIAIVGMSGRFPGANGPEELWRLLAAGDCAISEIPPDRFVISPDAYPAEARWLGALRDWAEFDTDFFELSPREAEEMDPRQRLLMQESWRALEDAGLTGRTLDRGRIGVFVGAEQGDYQRLGGDGGVTANHDGILAARLSYFLNLSAPVLSINTACSSGLVALHQACLSLRGGECEAAIAAGVNLLLSPTSFLAMHAAGMMSTDGRCCAFDRRASGMVPGEAAVAVVLKRLADALADGDPIRAVIAGHGINYDGRTNGITAPNGQAQRALIEGVHQRFGLEARTISHVVAHGTGTRLGDPIEVQALNGAFRAQTDARDYCALTSTKPNLGHTFAASGLVSVVALVQGLANEAIPPSLNCEEPSDYLDWASSPFFVNQTLRPWRREAGAPRLGAVSAFGMSGTNAHVVLAEPPSAALAPA